MRSFLLGACVATGFIAAPVGAATVTATTEFSVTTTDWTPSIRPDPENSQESLLVGSEIFEDTRLYNDPTTAPLLVSPTFNTGGVPFDWVHISHDLTLRVETTGPAGSRGSFGVNFGINGPSITNASYDRTDGVWTSGMVRSVGTLALSEAYFGAFSPGAFDVFWITGGAASYRNVGIPYTELSSDNYPSFHFLELSHLDGTLFGSITVTAGYGGEPEPAIGRSFTMASQVPLPASGLLMGGALLAGAGLRRRKA